MAEDAVMSFAIFLSASVPLPPPQRDDRYFQSADIIAIRDSIRALVTVVVPVGTIIFGGHPAITPMIRLLIRNMHSPVSQHLVLFQSAAFEGQFPPENQDFEHVVVIPAVHHALRIDHDASLRRMRDAMIRSHDFVAAFFIGGMEGVEQEYDLFRRIHPTKPAYPIASTGAAAQFLFDRHDVSVPELSTELTYLSLFRKLLNIEPR